MKYVDLRRHSLRGPTGDLTEDGRALARRATARTAASYSAFYSSPKPRAEQTAIAFGGKKPIHDPRLGLLSGAEIAPFDAPVRAVMETRGIGLLAAYFALEEIHPILRRKGEEVIQAVLEIAAALREDGTALAVSHGGSVEPAALIARDGEFDLRAIGGEFRECEGALLGVDGDRVDLVELIRL